MKRIAVVRIRGPAGVNRESEDTMRMLRLGRVNHCVIVDDRPTYMGMLRKVQSFVTWGELGASEALLRNRGELRGGERLTDEYVKKNSKFKGIGDFAKAFVDFKAELDDIPGLKPVFRLHPPRKGHGGVKKSFRAGGALGERDSMKELLMRMR
ncbi:MAG: 50S ribosomal protein L30 [Euryarchaeota archaeon]|nr:50S ribosomal protein L30 [Euryarchaeota archaeon]